MTGTLTDRPLQAMQLYLWPLCWDAWQATHSLRRSLHEFVDYVPPDRDPDAELRWWDDEVETGRMQVYGLFRRSDDRLVGTLKAFDFNPERTRCEIGIEILDHGDYGRGLGSEGLRHFLALLKDQGLITVFGLIHPDNARSRRFFARAGFRETGRVLDAQDPGMVFVRVEKQLV